MHGAALDRARGVVYPARGGWRVRNVGALGARHLAGAVGDIARRHAGQLRVGGATAVPVTCATGHVRLTCARPVSHQ
jgi:hypothetical protein